VPERSERNKVKMKIKNTIKPPFFEFGPKAYLYGKDLLTLAKRIDLDAKEHNVDVIITPQFVDIPILAKVLKHVHIFAQHMDSVRIGRGIGAILPEALADAGAEGVLLNHSEKRITVSDIKESISIAARIGLTTMVCADSPDEAQAIAHFSPDIIIIESPDLIEKSSIGVHNADEIKRINDLIKIINPEVLILHAAGIGNEHDVYNVIEAGADATGSTSAIIKAENQYEMFKKMIISVRKAWDNSRK